MILGHLARFCFSVRVRYAPSPTGPMHLGAVRTAFFNYLFAKNNQGAFILRIEDTDTERNISSGETEILNTLKWLGIQPHESFQKTGSFGPYIQTQRLQTYRQIQAQLIRNGYAYPCFCEQKQKNSNKKNEKKGNIVRSDYDGRCRKLTVEEVKQKILNGEKYVVRIKADIRELQINSFNDEIFGDVSAMQFDDFIITKRNRIPTYHFANVVDDWKMKITHVIRGAEWLTNTPKHIYLYKIFGVQPPIFMHLPLIYTPDGRKLSKRDPKSTINSLRDLGYQPEAIINYTGLMGYQPPQEQQQQKQQQQEQQQQQQEQEQQQKSKFKQKSKGKSSPLSTVKQFYSLKQLINNFNIENVNTSPIKSDPKKLNFFNRYYLRKKWKQDKGSSRLGQEMRGYLRKQMNVEGFSDQYLDQVFQCVLERVSNFSDLKNYEYFFQKPQKFNAKDLKQIFGANTVQQQNSKIVNCDPIPFAKAMKVLHNLRIIFQHILTPQEFTEPKIAQKISQFLYDNTDFENEDVYHLLRLAITGRKSGVNIVKTCVIIGRERVEASLKEFHQNLKQSKIDILM